jgi:hypothetical protein
MAITCLSKLKYKNIFKQTTTVAAPIKNSQIRINQIKNNVATLINEQRKDEERKTLKNNGSAEVTWRKNVLNEVHRKKMMNNLNEIHKFLRMF